MSNDEINRVRVEAFKNHGPVRIVRFRTAEGKLRFYVCSVDDVRIRSILAGGETERELLLQL